MKMSEISKIVAANPNTVFRTRRGCGTISGYSTKKWSYGATKATTKVIVQHYHTDGTAAGSSLVIPAQVDGVYADSVYDYVVKKDAERLAFQAQRDAARAQRDAKEAARTRNRVALSGREDEIKAALASILGCKQTDVGIDSYSGKVKIVLDGEVAVNIAAERAYCY